MKRFAFILLSLTALITAAQATPQARDMLYWNGVTYYVLPFIDVESRLGFEELENLNKRKTENPPTSNYRGYLCEFEITGDTLFLISIKDSDKKDITESVFGRHDRRALLDFSDTLYLGYGKSFYDHGWWTMVNESELTVVCKNGVVRWVKDNKNKSKYSPYTYDPQLFLKFVYSNIRWDELDKQALQTKPTVFVGVEIDSVDKIEDVRILRSSGYVQFDDEAIRVLKAIPSFSISFVNGKYLHHSYNYRIDFDVEKAQKLGVETVLFEADRTKDQLILMLEECIIKSKNKYDNSPYLPNKDKPLLLCRDGLPDPYIGNNKLFYESVGLQTMSWSNTKKHRKELRRGINVMEVSHGIVGNVLEIRVSMSTVKQDGNNITQGYWFEDVDKYIYEYSCESNEWRLVSADEYYDRDSGSFVSKSQDSIVVICQHKNSQYYYYGCYRMEDDTIILSENLIYRIEDDLDMEKKKGYDRGDYLVKQNEISRKALSPKEVTIVFNRENNSINVSLSAYQHIQTANKLVFLGCEDSCLLPVRKRFPYLSLQLRKDNSEHQQMRQK